jgi:hypothetical protein
MELLDDNASTWLSKQFEKQVLVSWETLVERKKNEVSRLQLLHSWTHPNFLSSHQIVASTANGSLWQ